MTREDVSMSASEVDLFLDGTRTAILSSIARDGGPHCAAMWFVRTGGEVRMWTYAKSQKAVNLRRDPRCAFVVEEGIRYDELRGVQVRGRARILTEVDEIEAIGRALYDRYALPYTSVPVDEGPHIEIARQAAKRIGIVLPLEDVSSWDHRKLGRQRSDAR